jgi:hypothetical protein
MKAGKSTFLRHLLLAIDKEIEFAGQPTKKSKILILSEEDLGQWFDQREGLDDTDPIPTFVGTAIESTWANAENGFTPMNCGQFRAFASHYYNHREKNFTNYTMLTIAATQAYMAGATAEQLNAFDISQGWD